MHKYWIIFLALSLISLVSFSQRKIKIIDIDEVGFEVDLDFSIRDNNVIMTEDGLMISIKPLNPSELDSFFFNNAKLTGKTSHVYYQNSKDQYFLNRRKNKYSRLKSDFEFFVNGLDWLINKELIDDNQYDLMSNYIEQNYVDEENQGTNFKIDQSMYNPYLIGNKYLSVFEVEITNLNEVPSCFDYKLFFNTEDELHQALSSSTIKDYYLNVKEKNPYKGILLDRFNISSGIILPSKAKLIRYAAIYPINNKAKSISSTIQNGKIEYKINWDIESNISTFNKSYKYYELQLDKSKGGYPETVFSFPFGNSDVETISDELLVKTDQINIPIKLITIGISSRFVYFNIKDNFLPSDYIDIKKSKRKKIKIDLEPISGIKRSEQLD